MQDIRSLHDKTAAKYPGKPYFIFGHSMGSFLTRTYLIRFRTGLDGAVISGTGHQSPSSRIGRQGNERHRYSPERPRHKSDFLNKMAFGTYNDKFENPRTSSDWLSRDEAAVDLYNEDPLCGFVPTAGLLHDMMNGIAFVTQPKNIARMKRICRSCSSPATATPSASRTRRDPRLQMLPQGRHEGRHHEALSRRTARNAQRNEPRRVYEDVLSCSISKTGK